ncbi:MAG: HD-GYP domain-containing protein [Leptospiraceae bacterium]|nr:HD-GYP domain-containing protein [Leptospiraceae bacterium]
MKIIKVSDLKPGIKFTKPLMLDRENVFINANVVLTDGDISRLNKFGFTEVMTNGDLIEGGKTSSNQGWNDAPLSDPDKQALKDIHYNIIKTKDEFYRVYKDAFDSVQAFYKKVAEDKPSETNQIRQAAEQIVDYIKMNPNFSFLLLFYNVEGFYLYNQSVKATFYAVLIAAALEYSRPRLVDMAFSCLLADVGMAKIPPNISEKNGTLNEEEYKVIKKHPLFGYQVLTKTYKLKNSLATIALQHHEAYDGSGYPQKLRKQEIEEPTCIYTVADNFAALTSNRPWRRRFQPYDAMKTMISVTMNKFDLNLLRVFLNKISIYPVGSYVELSDGSIGQVLEANNAKMLRPSLVIVKDPEGNTPNTGIGENYINLVLENQIYITKGVDFNYGGGGSLSL